MNSHGISPRIRISKLSAVSNRLQTRRNSFTITLKARDSSQLRERGRQPHSSRNRTDSASSSFRENMNRSSEQPLVKASLRSTKHRSQSGGYSDPDSQLASLSLPQPPPVVLRQFSSYMTKFEHQEVLNFPEIYYLGMKSRKVRNGTTDTNNGFDDDRSDYKLVEHDHIAYRYEILEVLGKGSFGQVCKCFDHKTKICVALKVIRNQKRFHRQGKVEVKVLKHIKKNNGENSHLVQMVDSFVFRNHLCITFELLNINLYELLKTNGHQGLSLSLVRRFAVQLLSCLAFMHEHNIIHCDLKPENILLKQANKSGIKVIDLGSSCFGNEKIYTYIQSRFYRAPEIMLGISYTTSIDMWSFGCILAELHSGYPLFPGESENEQFLCILEVKGLPPPALVQNGQRRKIFFDSNGTPRIVANSRGKKRIPGTRTIQDKIRTNDTNFVDLIESNLYLECLEWDPAYRITPNQAFKHPWIQEMFVRK